MRSLGAQHVSIGFARRWARPVIGRTCALEEAVEANRYVESGVKAGSLVLRIEDASLSPR